MQIDKLLENPIAGYIYLERYVNNGSPSGFSENTTSKITSPINGKETYQISVIQFDPTINVIEYGIDIGCELPPNSVYCHPDNLMRPLLKDISSSWNEISRVEVAPTASGRTVKCLKEHKFFIKLDYIGILGRQNRNLDKKRLLSALEVSENLSYALDAKAIGGNYQIFKETYGRIAMLPLAKSGYYELGFVLREEQPYPIISDVAAYIPFFSLFSLDKNSTEDEPIIIQLFRRQLKNATNFLIDNVIIPTVNFYFDTLVKCGLCLEAHAQNMLLGIDNNFQIVSIIVRDMESVDKDLPLREFLNLSTEFRSPNYKCLRVSDYNYQIMHSFMFDFKFGCYLIDPLLQIFLAVDGFIIDDAMKAIRHTIKLRVKELPQDYFPKQWYNYENKIFKQNEKRPYIANKSPKYR